MQRSSARDNDNNNDDDGDNGNISTTLKENPADVRNDVHLRNNPEPPSSVTATNRKNISTGISLFDKYDSPILEATEKYGFPDPLIIKSQMHLESFFDVYAISKDTPCEELRPSDWAIDEAHSYGLMQITPACDIGSFKDWNMLLPNGHPNLAREGSPLWQGSIFNPANNIPFAVEKMAHAYSYMEIKFPGCTEEDHLKMALSAYNASVQSVKGCSNFNEKGTAYVARIVKIYDQLLAAVLLTTTTTTTNP
jgi:soluble lytic murein transglycosylase-like protein